jgi:hypothetical protein
VGVDVPAACAAVRAKGCVSTRANSSASILMEKLRVCINILNIKADGSGQGTVTVGCRWKL